ncbi:MAG: Hsp20 family protein [SAR86 cluster bacterium]|jgi:molecular chaperone IbpA|nr:Hsp20 family protein [SAR86 cluster bacterium]
MVTTIETIWRDISPYAVGFDRSLNALSSLANSKSQTSNYPPYNIRRVSDDQYTIELALAGFDEKDIDIELAEDTLTIKGEKKDDMSEGLVHQGLASRDFIKKFILSDDMIVKGAALSNGMLYVGIERIIPDHKKPQKIELTSKKNLLG